MLKDIQNFTFIRAFLFVLHFDFVVEEGANKWFSKRMQKAKTTKLYCVVILKILAEGSTGPDGL